ncbi:MAG: phosphoribosylanthranilate isomerase, partial [Gammaproteobacteria bacterium]|nr:phosphoribosylanthranilate isomerase [Gammaproteobacteria bacterium]
MSRTLFRTRIKFCGLTRSGDVRLASELGVDAIGFVFAAQSPRRVRPDQARAMRNALEPLVDAVALFMDNSAEEVREVIRQVRPTLLQFHGSEDDAFCRGFGLPYMKAIAMAANDALDAVGLQCRYPGAAAFLFDGHLQGELGGNGERFDWSRIPTGLAKPFMVAGG